MVGNILKSFLVVIGYKTDTDAYKKAAEQIETMTSKVAAFAEEALATAAIVAVQFNNMASDLQKLYRASQLTGASAVNLKSWAYAADQVGIGGDHMAATINGITAALRAHPGYDKMLNAMGIKVDADPTKTLDNMLDAFERMKKMGPAGYAMAVSYAGKMSIDEDTLNKLLFYRKEMKAARDDYEGMVKSEKSLDLKKLTEDANKFEKMMGKIHEHWDIIKMVAETKLMPMATWIEGWMNRFLTWVSKADNATLGWAAAVTAVAASFATLKTAQMAVRYLLGGALEGAAGAGVGAGAGGAGAAAAGAAGVPAALVVGAIVAVGAALVWMQLHPDKVRAAVKGSWEWVKGEAGNAVTATKDILHSTKKDPASTLIGVATGISPVLGNVVASAIGTMTDIHQFISKKEGLFRNKQGQIAAYWDKTHWSIGYGTRANSPNEVITEEEAKRRRDAVITQTMGFVRSKSHMSLSDSQANALTSFAYNVGLGAFQHSTLLKKLNQGDLAGAAAELMRWDKVKNDKGQYVSDPGLHARRGQERDMLLQKPVTLTQNTNINVHTDTANAKHVADAVAKKQDGVNSTLVRNMKGATH